MCYSVNIQLFDIGGRALELMFPCLWYIPMKIKLICSSHLISSHLISSHLIFRDWIPSFPIAAGGPFHGPPICVGGTIFIRFNLYTQPLLSSCDFEKRIKIFGLLHHHMNGIWKKNANFLLITEFSNCVISNIISNIKLLRDRILPFPIAATGHQYALAGLFL